MGTRLAGAATALAGLVLLTGCSGGADSSSTSDASGARAAPSPDRVARAESGAASGSEAGGRGTSPAVQTRAVIKTGDLAVTSTHLTEVRADIDVLVHGWGGTVDREHTTNDRAGKVARSTLVLRVPADRFDLARNALARLGRVTSSHQSERDVTTQVIDVGERVRTLQNSLDRLHRFQRTATDVRDLLRYEDEITSRQAELQSTRAQQTYLSDQTSMATITLTLSRPAKHAAARPGALDGAGFLTGLRSGWHALVGAVVVVVTVLGAALPFGVVAGLLVVPVLLVLRRRSAAQG